MRHRFGYRHTDKRHRQHTRAKTGPHKVANETQGKQTGAKQRTTKEQIHKGWGKERGTKGREPGQSQKNERKKKRKNEKEERKGPSWCCSGFPAATQAEIKLTSPPCLCWPETAAQSRADQHVRAAAAAGTASRPRDTHRTWSGCGIQSDQSHRCRRGPAGQTRARSPPAARAPTAAAAQLTTAHVASAHNKHNMGGGRSRERSREVKREVERERERSMYETQDESGACMICACAHVLVCVCVFVCLCLFNWVSESLKKRPHAVTTTTTATTTCVQSSRAVPSPQSLRGAALRPSVACAASPPPAAAGAAGYAQRALHTS